MTEFYLSIVELIASII